MTRDPRNDSQARPLTELQTRILNRLDREITNHRLTDPEKGEHMLDKLADHLQDEIDSVEH